MPVRALEWIGVPPETLLVTLPIDAGTVAAASADAQPGADQVSFRRTLYRPRVLVTYYTQG
jgi:hypothetical protein